MFRAQLAVLDAGRDRRPRQELQHPHPAGGRFQLTPLYDVLSAWPIIGKKANEIPLEKVKLAMALPGQRPHYLLKSIQRRHFELLAKRMGVAEAGKIIDETAARAPRAIEAAAHGLPRGFPQQMLDRVLEGLRKSALLLAG